MKKTIILLMILAGESSFAIDYCKKDFMSNLEYATTKVDWKNKKTTSKFSVFNGNKNLNRQINKTTYNYLLYNFYDEEVANRWVELTRTYLKSEKEHLGIDPDISERKLFFDTLKEIGLFVRYDKKQVKEFYLELFKKYDFFSEYFQRPSIYKYMIMKNLGVASEKDLKLYFKQILSNGEIYDDHKTDKNYFAKRYYYAFYTTEDIGKIYEKFGSKLEKESILMDISQVCRGRKFIDMKRTEPLNKNKLINLFYASFVYPDIRPTIENYFNAIGLIKLWSMWNYDYYNIRGDYFMASHYFQVYYKKSNAKEQPKMYYDYIDIRTKELNWLMSKGRNYEAYENAIKIIYELSSIKEGITDPYFELVNKVKEAINDSSEVLLEHFGTVGDYKTYNRILNQRDNTVLHILKRKF